MRQIFALFFGIIFGLGNIQSQGVQTFSSSPNATIVRDNSYKSFNMTVSTSPSKTLMNSTWGLYRVKLNITHQSKFNLSVQLVSPGGTVIQLFTKPGTVSTYENFVDTYFRDDAPMTMATFLGATTTYRRNTPASWIPENSFTSTINTGATGTPNGTWTLKIRDGGGTYTGTLNSWELEFRDTPNGNLTSSVWVTNSETGYPNYNDCSFPKKIDKYYNYYGRTRLTYDENASTDPIVGTAGSPWRLATEGQHTNATIDNTIWYSFRTDATGGTANVFISMINKYSGSSTGYQAVVLDPGASPCVAANWTRVAGSAYVGDNSLGTNPNPLSGPAIGTIILYNSVLKCTGLAANKTYYVCVDGVSSTSGTATSDVDFQIEVTGNVLENFTVLPIELLYFKGEGTSNINTLSWATASEINNAYFEIEKSVDAINFVSLSKIESGSLSGSSSRQLTYKYNDVACNAYYRLKQVDLDGSYKYHKTIFVENSEEKNKPLVMPNPASNYLTISYHSKTDQLSTIKLFDISGREVLSGQTLFNSDNQEFLLNIEELKSGLYFLSINTEYKTYQQKIIKE
ncbi:MAG: T9SS type A sorting domain-containing protein [Bacteroidia bacterium]|nr:T9SS type A sorting domain-containing protein [Bacteroidia bacterium]